jgi:metal-responsive CopG/Arc/MetJ family transcriptional regulator
MTNITREDNLDMIREAVRTYLENFSNEELEAEMIRRGE